MAINTYRLDVKIPSELKYKLNALRREYTEKTGKYVSMSKLIFTIVEDYINKLPIDIDTIS